MAGPMQDMEPTASPVMDGTTMQDMTPTASPVKDGALLASNLLAFLSSLAVAAGLAVF
jgi:hypothetical protein